MKKILCLLIAFCMMFSVVGCGKSEKTSSEPSNIESSSGTGFDAMFGGEAVTGNSSGTGTSDGKTSNSGTSGNSGDSNSGNSGTTSIGQVTVAPPSDKFPGRVTDLKGRTIKVLIWDNAQTGGDGSSAGNEFKKLNAKIEKTYNCKLEFMWEAGEDFMASIAAGAPTADIWGINNITLFMNAYTAGLLQPMDKLGVIDFEDNSRYTSVTALSKFNGQHYGVGPRTYSHLNVAWAQVMLVNFDLLKKANSKYTPDYLYGLQNSNKWTWDKFEEIANDLITAGVQPVEDFASNVSSISLYQTLLNSNEADWIAREGDTARFTGGEGAALDALNKYEAWSKSGIIKQVKDNATGVNNFTSGKTAFLASYMSATSAAQITVMKNYGVIYPPMGPNMKERKPYTGKASFAAIPKNVKDPAAVATILMQLCTPIYNDKQDRVMALQYFSNAAKLQQSVNTCMEIYDKTMKNHGPFTLWYGVSAGAKIDTSNKGDGWYDLVKKIGNQSLTSAGAVSSAKNNYNTKLKSLFTVR